LGDLAGTGSISISSLSEAEDETILIVLCRFGRRTGSEREEPDNLPAVPLLLLGDAVGFDLENEDDLGF
jgi:hypothetical protein